MRGGGRKRQRNESMCLRWGAGTSSDTQLWWLAFSVGLPTVSEAP